MAVAVAVFNALKLKCSRGVSNATGNKGVQLIENEDGTVASLGKISPGGTRRSAFARLKP